MSPRTQDERLHPDPDQGRLFEQWQERGLDGLFNDLTPSTPPDQEPERT